MSVFKHIPQIKSFSIPTSQNIYTGVGNGIHEIVAHTEEGDFLFYNEITPGIRIEPPFFEKSGSQECTIIYHTGTNQGTLKTEANVNVIKEIPVLLTLKRGPRNKKFKELEVPNIEGATFTVTFNTGRKLDIESNEVKASLNKGELSYYYEYNGAETSFIDKVDSIRINGIDVGFKEGKTSTFEAGTEINPLNFKVEVLYSDNTSSEVQGFTVSPSIVKNGDKELTISYDKFTKTIPIKVTTNLSDFENQLHVDENGNYNIVGNVKLIKDINTGSKRINILGEGSVVNLNKHTLDTQWFAVYKPFTLKNGKLNLHNNSNRGIYIQENAGDFLIDNVEITTDCTVECGSVIHIENSNGVLKDCIINQSNGTLANDFYIYSQWQEGCEITLTNVSTNSLIASNGATKNINTTLNNCVTTAGVYVASSGSFEINGGNYSSSTQSALEIKAGDVVIKGGEFTSTASKSHNASTSGSSTKGYDIAIVSNGKYEGGTVNIKEGVAGEVTVLSDDGTNNIVLNDERVIIDSTKDSEVAKE